MCMRFLDDIQKFDCFEELEPAFFVLSRTFLAPDDSLHKILVRAKHMIHKKLLHIPTPMTF
jgi:hypothetical protein